MDDSSNSDENYDLGYQASPSSLDQNDQSPTETSGFSALSGNSFAHCRTNSETSAFSEPTDENGLSETLSPSRWPVIKSSHQTVLSRFGMRHHKNVLYDEPEDHQEVTDLGE